MADSMVSPDAADSDECRRLKRLRGTPQIFADIAACSPAERSSQRRLRQLYDEELVRAALSLDEARARAAGLLPSADRLWLTRIGLEQATAWPVAQHKARRFADRRLPDGDALVDLCSGIGVDAAALASVAPVIAVDLDPAMCLRTEWNAMEWGTPFPVASQCLDVTGSDWSRQIVHVDPDRRAGRDRPVKRLEQYQPDLAWMQQLVSTAAGGAIKLGPASNFMQKFPGCEIELISLDGECREATVWFGCLAGRESFRATVLPGGETIAADPLSAWAPQATACDAWIFDPDPAVVRSGMLDAVAEQLGLARLDPEEEYLTGAQDRPSGFVTGFEVEAILPNSMRELKHWLRTDPSPYYEVKCRHIPVDAAAFQRQLPKGSAAPRVIFLARVDGRARAIVARRTPAD